MVQQRVSEIAVHTAFLFAGACEELDKTGREWVNGGYIGMAIDLVYYAEAIYDALRKYQDWGSWPSVFAYDVTEPLGEWVARHRAGQLMVMGHDPEFQAELDRRIAWFFAQ